jgi:hypothetical protein
LYFFAQAEVSSVCRRIESPSSCFFELNRMYEYAVGLLAAGSADSGFMTETSGVLASYPNPAYLSTSGACR